MGYLKRQERDIKSFKKDETVIIPKDINFNDNSVELISLTKYNNDIKSDVVGVKNDILEKYGAVSEEVASELASGIAKKLNSDIGVGITGIAGPTGGTEKKPVGLIFVGIFYKNNVYIKQYNLTPNRKVNRELTVVLCLNELRKILEKD